MAIVGVSENPENLARNIVSNLIEFQFPGEIFLVGNKEGNLFGKPIRVSIDELPEEIDVAIILTPAPTVPGLLESCGRKRIRWVVVETGGFREYSEAGAHLEEQLLQIARTWGIRIVGPNGVGIFNMENGFLIPFLRVWKDSVRRGKVSILSQSGGVLFTYLNLLSSANVGIAKMVSMGNKIDLGEVEYLKYLIQDPETDIIGLYAEGLERGRELMDIARSTSKPILIQKANTGMSSRHIAKLHTAALANDDQVLDAALKQANVIRVRDFRSFVNATKILSLPAMKGNRLAILSRSGGIAIIAADVAETYGFHLSPFPKHFRDRVHSYFRAKVIQPTNPLDLGDLFDFDLYIKILEQVLKAETVDGILFQHGSTGMDKEPSRNLIRALGDLSVQYQKPIALCYLTSEDEMAFIRRTIDYPIFAEPGDGLSALAISRDHHRGKTRPKDLASAYSVNRERVSNLLRRAVKERRNFLLPEALDILKAYGIPIAKGQILHQKGDLKKATARVGKPVALKVFSPEIFHKSDVGGVALHIDTLSGAERVYEKMKGLCVGPSSGVYVQKMIDRGKEVILGAKRDPSFGPVLLFGLGGIYVEVLQEMSLRVAPITRSEAKAMISESKAGMILKGIRGEGALDSKAVVESLLRLSQLMIDFPEIEGIDINPLKVLKKGAVALDARILLTKTGEK